VNSQKIKHTHTIITKKLIKRGIIKGNIPFNQVQVKVRSLIKNTNTLTEKEKDVLTKRISHSMTLRAIALRYKVSSEWIRHLENRALSKLMKRWPIYPKEKSS